MADHFTPQTQQVAAAIEATPGTAETLVAADVTLRPYAELSYQPNPNRFENSELGDDLGQADDFVSGKKGNIIVPFTVKGSGTTGTAPALGVYLRACGFREELVETIGLTAPPSPGSFAEGASYTSPGKTGIIEQLTAASPLRYIVLTGGSLTAADVVTVGANTATTTGANTNYATRYTPRTLAQETVTLSRYIKNTEGTANQDYENRIIGAMGSGSIEFGVHDAIRFSADFMGVESKNGASDLFAAGDVTYETAANASIPKFINSTFQLDGKTLVPSAFTLNFGNEVDMDPDGTSAGGSTPGYDRARILNRAPEITLDPRRVTPTVFDDLLKLVDGSTFVFSFISSGSAGQIVEILAQACQIRGWSEGNRANLQIADMSIACTRRSVVDSELKIYFR